MTDYLFTSLSMIIPFLIPAGYAIYKKINNKLLFIGSVFGITYIVFILIYLAWIPVLIFLSHIAPTLKEIGIIGNLLWAIEIIEFVAAYWWVAAFLITPLFPIIISKRYKSIFDANYT